MALLLVDLNENPSVALPNYLNRHGINAIVASASQLNDYLTLHQPDLVLISVGSGAQHLPCALSLTRDLQNQYPSLPVALMANLEALDRQTLLDILKLHFALVLPCPSPGFSMGSSQNSSQEDAFALQINRVMSQSSRLKSDATHLEELERDQRAGRYIQTHMLPPSPMAIDGYRLRHRLFPSLLLSGDFVDYFRITDSHFVFYLADVSGHGASSAFVTVLLKNFSRRLRREFHPRMLQNPAEIVAGLNVELLENQIDKHVSMILGVVDTEDDRLALVNAGHFPMPILVSQQGAGFLESHGKPIGLFQEVDYTVVHKDLSANDRLLLVSDGILEVLPGVSIGQKEQLLLRSAEQTRQSETPYWDLLNFSGSLPGPDDISCLTVVREA